MLKKKTSIILIILAIIIVIVCVVCFGGKKGDVSGSLEDIISKLYQGISEDELPMALGNVELTDENIESFIGTTEVKYTEAIANESMVGSIAHSVVLLRVEDGSNVEEAVQKIKENVNPRKWICVEASNVIVKNRGDLVILIMSNETLAPKLETNFDNL